MKPLISKFDNVKRTRMYCSIIPIMLRTFDRAPTFHFNYLEEWYALRILTIISGQI